MKTKISKKTTKSKTIGEMAAEGELPPDLIVPMNVKAIGDLINDTAMTGWNAGYEFAEREARGVVCDMILPNGMRFGDAMPVDLIDYADMTMDELTNLLVAATPNAEIDEKKAA